MKARWMIEGVALPAVLTLVTVLIGFGASVRSFPELGWNDHLFNGLLWIKVGVGVSFLAGGVSLPVLFSDLGDRAGRWRLLGGVVALSAIALVAWSTWDVEFRGQERFDLPSAIELLLNRDRD